MEAEKIINLTPHSVKIFSDSGYSVVFEKNPNTPIARIEEDVKAGGSIFGVPLSSTSNIRITGLPEKTPGVFYIVSHPLAMEARRPDLLFPRQMVCDPVNGRVIGAKSLSRIDSEDER